MPGRSGWSSAAFSTQGLGGGTQIDRKRLRRPPVDRAPVPPKEVIARSYRLGPRPRLRAVRPDEQPDHQDPAPRDSYPPSGRVDDCPEVSSLDWHRPT